MGVCVHGCSFGLPAFFLSFFFQTESFFCLHGVHPSMINTTAPAPVRYRYRVVCAATYLSVCVVRVHVCVCYCKHQRHTLQKRHEHQLGYPTHT